MSSKETRFIEPARQAAESLAVALRGSMPPADSLPGYQLTREIHRGGQGVVYQAVHKGTQRKVAIKVMREGPFAGAQDRARFEREMHILGQLDDPHIVGIHDSGSAGGSFYFVMDYVAGQSLDEYIRNVETSKRRNVETSEPQLSMDDSLRLFVKICAAVHAAHLRGVIHRDLKPGNIRIDPHGEPHILDFGLAKVASGVLAEDSASVMSITGQFIGSLPWASPEQAAGHSSKIDMRTDVYSLGVILYQMLTGRFPYPVVGNMRDVVDHILRTEPVKPHTIRKEIDDEVETIVLKCLDKAPERRYQSAGELARDIGHYLADEPIEAKRDSNLYVLKKALKRNKIAVAIASLFLTLGVGFVVVTSFLYALAESETTRAEVAIVHAEMERVRAEAETHAAHENLELLRTALAGANLEGTGKPNQTTLELLRKAVEKAEKSLAKNPAALAEIYLDYGRACKSRDFHGEAIKLLKKGLELSQALYVPKDPKVAEFSHHLAAAYWRADDFGSAEPLYRSALEIREAVYGPEHEQTAESLGHLATCLASLGLYYEAEKLAERSLKIRRELPDNVLLVAWGLNQQAAILKDQRKFKDALERYSEALDRFETYSKQDAVAKVLGSIGECLLNEGRCEEARQNLVHALELKSNPAVMEADDVSIANTQRQMARLYLLCTPQDLTKAEEKGQEALSRYQLKQPPIHHDIGESLHVLGAIRLAQDNPGDALPDLLRATEILRKTLLDGHWRTIEAELSLGQCLARLGRYEEAENHLEWSCRMLRERWPACHSLAQETAGRFIELYEAWGKPEQATLYRDGANPCESPEMGAAQSR